MQQDSWPIDNDTSSAAESVIINRLGIRAFNTLTEIIVIYLMLNMILILL